MKPPAMTSATTPNAIADSEINVRARWRTRFRAARTSGATIMSMRGGEACHRRSAVEHGRLCRHRRDRFVGFRYSGWAPQLSVCPTVESPRHEWGRLRPGRGIDMFRQMPPAVCHGAVTTSMCPESEGPRSSRREPGSGKVEARTTHSARIVERLYKGHEWTAQGQIIWLYEQWLPAVARRLLLCVRELRIEARWPLRPKGSIP